MTKLKVKDKMMKSVHTAAAETEAKLTGTFSGLHGSSAHEAGPVGRQPGVVRAERWREGTAGSRGFCREAKSRMLLEQLEGTEEERTGLRKGSRALSEP